MSLTSYTTTLFGACAVAAMVEGCGASQPDLIDPASYSGMIGPEGIEFAAGPEEDAGSTEIADQDAGAGDAALPSDASSKRVLETDDELVAAGGVDKYIERHMAHDGKFRLYSYSSVKTCGACRALDAEVDKLLARRADVNYTIFDVMGFTSTPFSGSIPDSILQYDNCKKTERFRGVVYDDQFDDRLAALKKKCEK